MPGLIFSLLQTFPLPEFRVDSSVSRRGRVVLTDLSRDAEGIMRCEVRANGLFTLECHFQQTFVSPKFAQTFLFCLVFTLTMFRKYYWNRLYLLIPMV